MTLTEELLQLPNIIGIISLIATSVLGIWLYRLPRKISATATAILPVVRFDPTRLPFSIQVINTNTRQFKINEVCFETLGRYLNKRKNCICGYRPSGTQLRSDKLLLTEGDSTEIAFDGYEIARWLADQIQTGSLHLVSSEIRIWLYLTHGKKVLVEANGPLSEKILGRVREIIRQPSSAGA